MTTNNPLPVPTAAPRGAIQRTFVNARVLAGFTDPSHFELLAGEYLKTLDEQAKAAVLSDADAARAFVATLQGAPPTQVVLRDISNAHVDAIRQDPLFTQTFGLSQFRFAYVNPAGLIALQAWVEPRADSVPGNEAELLEFALPRSWDVPTEVSFVRPNGPIQVLSSNPAMQNLAMDLDEARGTVSIGAPKHLNLIQVVHFSGKYFLRNGYHRITDALVSGQHEVPAIVVEAYSPEGVALPGATAFGIGYVLGLDRPPLVRDFHTAAGVTTKVRERRYGFIVSLDIKRLDIGI